MNDTTNLLISNARIIICDYEIENGWLAVDSDSIVEIDGSII